jgi:hypothetical protein
MTDNVRRLEEGYQAKRKAPEGRGYQPKGGAVPLDPLKLKPPKGGDTAIQPPKQSGDDKTS